jgi:hypothetical protein
MPYSGDPATSPIDEVRFWAQDTGTPPLLSDPEITSLINYYVVDFPDGQASPLLVAALAADRIAAKYVGFVNISADGVNYSGDQLQQRWSALAKSLRESEKTLRVAGAGPYVGGILRNQAPPPGVEPPEFGIGMNDNPEAMDQSGGWYGTTSLYGPNEPADIYGSP